MKTQAEKILGLLSDNNWHSTLEMRNDLFIMQPATRIFELKETGEKIESKMMPCTPDPNSAKIAWYRTKPEVKQYTLGFDIPRSHYEQ